MEPAAIKKTIKAAKTLERNSNYGTPEALLLAYVAWEGLRNRVLICGLSQQGWTVTMFKEAIAGHGFWLKGSYDEGFSSVFGKNPQNLSGVSKIWDEAEKARILRNKFVHGLSKGDPEALWKSYSFLIETISDLSWTKKLEVSLPDGTQVPLKDIETRNTPNRKFKGGKTVEGLRRQLKLAKQ